MANSKIPNLNLSDTLNTQRLKFNQLLDSVGDVSTLTTTAGPVTDAINELDAELGTITSGAMGTTASTVSGAIAELDGRLDSINNTELLSPRATLSDSSATNIVRGNLQVDTDLHVGGNTTMSGTLTVDGQVTFKAGSDNNISLGDASTDTITLTGEVNSNVVPDADDTYDLGSASKEWRHVYVDGTVNTDNVAADSATIGTLTVTGDTTFNNTITVQDSAYITGDLDVGAELTVATQAILASAAVSDLTNGRVVIAGASGELQDDGKLTWNTTTGLKTTEALTVEDSAYVTGNLNVGGNLGVTGNITLGGDITIGDANTDNVAFNADINSSIIPNTDNAYDLGSASQEWRHVYVDGTVNADNVAADSATIGTLTVTGDTTLNNTITVQDSAYITGDLVLGSNLKTPTSFTLGAAATSISIGDYNTGTTTIQHDLVVDSNLTVHGLTDLDSTSITGNLIMNTDKFTVDHLGNTVIAGTLDVNDVISLDSAVIANLEVTGLTTLENALTVQDSAYITGNTAIGGNLTVGGGFTVSGTFTTTGTTRNAASYVIVNDQVSVAPSNRAGLAVDRPGTDSAVMQWNEQFDYWEAGTTNNLRQLARQDDSAAFTNVYVGGNLTVNGTTTTVNSTTVEIGDNIILLNDSLAGSGIANAVDAGIEIERGTSTNVQLLWDESEDYWVAANDGSNTLSRIATAAWLDATAPISFNSSTGNISHDNTTRSDTTTAATLSHSDAFEVVDSIQSNSKGHVTKVNTRTITLPAGAVPNNATITISGGTDLETGGDFTTDQAGNETITLDHSNVTRTNVSFSQSPGYGGSFDVVDSIQSSATGHITRVATRTITLPASDNTDTNTTYSLDAVQAGTDNAQIGLNAGGSGSGRDYVMLVGGTNVSLTRDSDRQITITSTDTNTDTNTTYSISSETGTGGANLRLTAGGSGSGTDDVLIAGSGATTVTRTDANTITISSTDTDTNTTYSAGNDLDLSGTTFNIESELNFVNTINYAGNITLKANGGGETIYFQGGEGTSEQIEFDLGYTREQIIKSSDTMYFQATNNWDVPFKFQCHNLANPDTHELKIGLGTTQQSIVADDIISVSGDSATFYGTNGARFHSTYKHASLEANSGGSTGGNVNIIANGSGSPTQTGQGGDINLIARDLYVSGQLKSTINMSVDGYGTINMISPQTGMRVKDSADAVNNYFGVGWNSTYTNVNVGRNFLVNGADGVTLYPGGSEHIYLSGGAGGFGTQRGHFDVQTSDTIKLYTGQGAGTLNSTWSGDDLTVQGDVNSVSDVRTKENIETVENGLDLVSQLRGVWYNKIGEEDRKVGVIAQEVEEVLPEVVNTDTEGMKSVDYGKMVGVLIEAIKELKQEIEELKSK